MRFIRSESVEIQAAREHVFALVADIPNRTDWPAKGSIRLISSAAPHRCVYECCDSGGCYRWTFDLTTSPTGTTVHQTVERVGASGYVKLLQPFVWELSQCGRVRAGLDWLKQVAERPSIPAQRQPAAGLPSEATRS